MFLSKSRLRFLIIGLLIVAASLASALEIQKSPYDKRQYESFTLKNGLRVVLVSDPELELAAASLNVQVGSFQDPDDRLGLAHFLEHMLFLGTKKYPDPAEYSQYIAMHGGMDNAWTSDMNTQYFFTIVPQYLPGALDRFAQFFIAPNFDADLVDRERNAVNSEYQLHIKQDVWRVHEVAAVTGNPQHPITRFTIGDRQTLGDANHARNIRDQLIEFHQQHYSADRMILVVAAPQSLADLKDLVTTYFSDIPRHAVSNPEFDTLAYTQNEAGKMISVKTLGDYQELMLTFPVPPQYPHYDKQSLAYILKLIMQPGPGSLLQYLKDKNWIVDLQAYSQNISYNQDLATIDLSLTTEGYKHTDEIIAYFFAYIDFLEHTTDGQVFSDLKAAGQRNFMYPEAQTAEQIVLEFPTLIQHYPTELILKADDFSNDTQFDPEHIQSLLNYFSPKNMRVLVLNNQIQGTKTEPYFNVAYSETGVTRAQLKSWQNPAGAPKFALPKPNPFMPEDFKQKSSTVIVDDDQVPQKVLARPGTTLWFKQDQKFKLPKENIFILFAAPEQQSTARRAVLQQFMLMAMQDKLRIIGQDLLLAGVTAYLSGNQQGLILIANMFSDKETEVLTAIEDGIKDYRIDNARFVAYKDNIARDLANFKQNLPFQQAITITQTLIQEPEWLPQDLLAELPQVTQQDVEQYTQEFFNNAQMEILVHGNVTQQAATKFASDIAQHLPVNTVRKDNQIVPELIKLSSGANFTYAFDPSHDDSTIVSYMQAPRSGDQAIATNALLNEILQIPFYDQLRTKEQLGYVVRSTLFRVREQPGLLFLIESPERKPDYLHERVANFTTQFDKDLSNMDAKDFANFKKSLQHNLLKKPTSLTEESSRYWEQIIDGTYRFDFNMQIAKQVGNLKLKDISNYYRDIWLNPNTRKLITVISKSDQPYTDGEPINSISNFKAEAVYTNY